MSMTHVLETITPLDLAGDPDDAKALLLLLDCSCGAEIESEDSAEGVEVAFREHVPGDWVIVREHPGSLCGSRLASGAAGALPLARPRSSWASPVIEILPCAGVPYRCDGFDPADWPGGEVPDFSLFREWERANEKRGMQA